MQTSTPSRTTTRGSFPSRASPSQNYASRFAAAQRIRSSASRVGLIQAARQTGQVGPTRYAASLANSYAQDALVGASQYGRSSSPNARYGTYNRATGQWNSGYRMSSFRGPVRNSPAYRNMAGSQGSWLSARRAGPISQTRFEVSPTGTGRRYDRLSGMFFEDKVGGNISGRQLATDISSGRRVHYNLMSSPLSNASTRLQNGMQRMSRVAAQTSGRVTGGTQPGPSRGSLQVLRGAANVDGVLRGASRVAVPAAIAIDTYRLASAYRRDGGTIGTNTTRTAADVGGAWAGAGTGAVAGGKAGAVVGTFVGGPVGTAVGTVVGGVVGAVGGAVAGSALGRSLHSFFSGRGRQTSSVSRRNSRRSTSLSSASARSSVSSTSSRSRRNGRRGSGQTLAGNG